jgi:hypothetical protein
MSDSQFPKLDYSNPEFSIQPIEVIERWALCHHLGCVVRHIAATDFKIPALGDLKKAEWYLARELERPMPCITAPMGVQPFTTEAVLDDWGLSFRLNEVLFHLKASKSPSMRKESLTQGLKHLRAEISTYEQKEGEQS